MRKTTIVICTVTLFKKHTNIRFMRKHTIHPLQTTASCRVKSANHWLFGLAEIHFVLQLAFVFFFFFFCSCFWRDPTFIFVTVFFAPLFLRHLFFFSVHNSRNRQKKKFPPELFFSYCNKKMESYKSLFKFIECGGGGDCMFHVISTAFSELFARVYTMQDIRFLTAQSIDKDNVSVFQTTFGLKAKDLQHIQQLVNKQGHAFIGSVDLLEWMVNTTWLKEHNLGFVVYSSYGLDFPTVVETPSTTLYLLMANINNSHWQLIKYKQFSFISKTILHSVFLTKKF